MENSTDSYLHKKFKKQSSVEPKSLYLLQHNESKSGVVDAREEKNDNQIRKDNNESVPNQSTNQNSSLSSPRNNFSKSSISLDECRIQSSNSCISWSEQSKPSFDTTTEPVSTSSILDNLYSSSKPNYVKPEDVSSNIAKDHEEGGQAPQDKGPAGGKYVCPYCSLVCSKPSVLQKHIRAHTNERPYPCNSCGFSFKTRSNLYKHCRSRTHANRVMGNKVQEMNNDDGPEPQCNDNEEKEKTVDLKTKPYKPRFHTKQFFKENEENKEETNKHNSNLLSDHINDIISKNNSIVNSGDYVLKKRSELSGDERHIADLMIYRSNVDEPLNLTKNRKRSMSEVVEPVAQKSLIKELLLKNLNSDMQCPHCKMIFQTVTELELHKLRSCKGFVQPGAKYTRSSSVNVASILTQNKNAFDGIPHLQNAFLPLKSPGPFLGKTRLVDSDKNKSFSFDDGLPAVFPPVTPKDRYLLSPLTLPSEKEKKTPVKLFGGEVKITHTTGETKSFKIDNKDDKYDGLVEYSGKLSENRVVKSGLQSGCTVLTNKANYPKDDLRINQDVIRVYENSPVSPSIDISPLGKPHINFNRQGEVYRPADIIVRTQVEQFSVTSSSYKYTNIMDFSQKAVKLLTPNLKQPNLTVPGVPAPTKFTFPPILSDDRIIDLEKPKEQEPQNLTTKVFQPRLAASQPELYNPMKLLVNGKVVRYVPGIPGPVAAEEPLDMAYAPIVSTRAIAKAPPKPEAKMVPPKMETLEVKTDFPFKVAELKSPKAGEKSPVKTSEKSGFSEPKKFARPNSLALKPTTASLKQHHGLTPTKFNQILISPDTPRVAKKYVQQFLHGNYFSYLGLKSSTKPVYCTLNKTQPFYVFHFKKLSMYSEWRQQDTKTEKLFVSAYDSRQRHQRYTTAGKAAADLVVHSSYKFVVSEISSEKNEENQKSAAILGGYECNDDYTYVRGRGRGRYVCEKCGIRCKKPSMLKKHIKTHSNDRPFTCNHCNFSFKTKGNLTKHMKSKAHSKNSRASSSGSSTQQSGTQSSESDTEDSGMDSSDESTRREEHEAAYGLLSLAQKTSPNLPLDSSSPIPDAAHHVLNTEEIAHASKTNYVKNKILDDKTPLNFSAPRLLPTATTIDEVPNLSQFLGTTSIDRPLTYPYTSVLSSDGHAKDEEKAEKSIKQFHVIQKYAAPSPSKVRDSPKQAVKDRTRVSDQVKVNSAPPPVLKVNDSPVADDAAADLRKRKLSYADEEFERAKQAKNDEVMDLSMPVDKDARYNGSPKPDRGDAYHVIKKADDAFGRDRSPARNNGYVVLAPIPADAGFVLQEGQPLNGESPKPYKPVDYDNSAMETLADIATKQVKLEKNTLAKSVASEYLKIATKNESGDPARDPNFGRVAPEVNDLIVRPEGNKSCHICAKSFSKAPQLRLHMNIHYLERPYRCHSCSVSFRTRGHLQKHERSASHHNKLSSSPALSSSEPRPFKCVDCSIAFRIHGHLAKHLRSKMHIMKLECLAKIPFGLYAELERSNSLLTEINTADGDQCLESLKTLAKKVFINDPSKLNQLTSVETADADS